MLLLTSDADAREIAREKMAFSYGLQRFGVWGLGCGVWGLMFRVCGFTGF